MKVERLRFTHHSDEDGIPDYVERQSDEFAVPVIRTVNGQQTFQMRYLDLDPDKADTDDDGLNDRTEVSFETREKQPTSGGQGAIGEMQEVRSVERYYSHPNLVNTDGIGLDDRREYENESDPIVPERLVIGFRLPTIAKKTNDDPERWKPKEGGLYTDDAYTLALADVYKSHRLDGGKPGWLSGQDVDVDNSKKYLLVKGYVYVSRQGNLDANYVLPQVTQLSLKGGRTPAEIVSWNRAEATKRGAVALNIIIEVPDGTVEGNIGRFEFEMYTDEHSPFDRPSTNDERQGSGSLKTVTTSHSYTIREFGLHSMETVVRESMEKFKQGMLMTMNVYKATQELVIAAQMGNSVTKEAIKTVAKEVTTKVIKRKAKRTVYKYVSGRRIKNSYERNEAQKIVINGGVAKITKWFVHTGPMITRRN